MTHRSLHQKCYFLVTLDRHLLTIKIIQYQGSTGTPKGVVITHRNVVNALNSWLYQLNAITVNKDDKWIGYLPLAHILELLAEMMMLVFGIRIGTIFLILTCYQSVSADKK